MKRILWFAVLVVSAVAAFLLLFGWYAAVVENESMGNMTNQIMESGNANGMAIFSTMPFYMWVSIAVLGTILIIGIFGLVYYLVFPEIKRSSSIASSVTAASGASAVPSPSPVDPGTGTIVGKGQSSAEATPRAGPESWRTLLRTSKPNERMILELLATNNWKYLQRSLVRESGLSKLKVHGIISRLADRDVLIVEKSGNTNEVKIADWLRKAQDQPAGHKL